MRELVIVLSDWYEHSARHVGAAEREAFPALAHLARYGTAEALVQGWREWLARWIGRGDLAHTAPAAVAAAALESAPAAQEFHWLAPPVHLIASLRGVHLDFGGLLRLERPEQERLASSFNETFLASGYRLSSLPAGGLLASGPPLPAARTVEPARLLGSSVAAALPGGTEGRELSRIATEIEMWLHEHPVNLERVRRGERPVTALWLWGGGAAVQPGAAMPPALPAAYGSDAYLHGLWRLAGADARPAMEVAAIAASGDARAVLVASLFDGAGAASSPVGALPALEARYAAPALDAISRGVLERLTIVANDRLLSLRRRDRMKFWRRPRGVLAGLQ